MKAESRWVREGVGSGYLAKGTAVFGFNAAAKAVTCSLLSSGLQQADSLGTVGLKALDCLGYLFLCNKCDIPLTLPGVGSGEG